MKRKLGEKHRRYLFCLLDGLLPHKALISSQWPPTVSRDTTLLLPSKYHTHISPSLEAQFPYLQIWILPTLPPNSHCKIGVPRLHIKSYSPSLPFISRPLPQIFSNIFSNPPVLLLHVPDKLSFAISDTLTVLRLPNPPTPITWCGDAGLGCLQGQ